MHIEHLAIWVDNLELMRSFYEKYFSAVSCKKYTNTKKQFNPYFLSFEDGGARIELMHRPDIEKNNFLRHTIKGYTHIAIAAGSKEKVNQITEQLRLDGYKIIGEPRTTGDGYYESVILDPEGNSIEITV